MGKKILKSVQYCSAKYLGGREAYSTLLADYMGSQSRDLIPLTVGMYRVMYH